MSENIRFERYRQDEKFRAALHAHARREHAETVHRLLVRPLLDLVRWPFRLARRSSDAPSQPALRAARKSSSCRSPSASGARSNRCVHSTGMRPEDVRVKLVEAPRENWSFGMGVASCTPTEPA